MGLNLHGIVRGAINALHPDVDVQIVRSLGSQPDENDTLSYVRHVASAVGRGADEVLPFDVDPSYYLAIARAIARHENGIDAESISSDTWEEAAKMAGL